MSSPRASTRRLLSTGTTSYQLASAATVGRATLRCVPEPAKRLASSPDTPAACHAEIRTRRCGWPDLDDVHAFFMVRLWVNTGGWKRVADTDAVDAGLRLSDSNVARGEIRADLARAFRCSRGGSRRGNVGRTASEGDNRPVLSRPGAGTQRGVRSANDVPHPGVADRAQELKARSMTTACRRRFPTMSATSLSLGASSGYGLLLQS